MDPRKGQDVFYAVTVPAGKPGEQVKRTRLAPEPRPARPAKRWEPRPDPGGLSFQVVLHTAQVPEVAEQIEDACRRDGLGLALDQRASGAYGSLSVDVTGPAERVNALRSSLAKIIRR